MSELRDEIMASDFSAYRRKEIEAAAEFVSLVTMQNADYVRGAMDMFRKILNIPVVVAKTPELAAAVKRMIDEDFARFTVEYIRRAIREE